MTRNVATLVDLPRLAHKPVQSRTPAQGGAFLYETKDDRLGPLFHVVIATGFRQGELVGLRWNGVDLGVGTITVRHARHRVRTSDGHAGARLVDPKTDKSRRTVNRPASAVAAFATRSVVIRTPLWYSDDVR